MTTHRTTDRRAYGMAMALALTTMALIVVAEGALGLNGEPSALTGRLELGVFAIFVVGSLVVRLRARPMTIVMVLTAGAQVCAGVFAVTRMNLPTASMVSSLGVNLLFAALFCGSAMLFRLADRRDARR